jgi:glucosyl-3-phosphoglycerate synthase
VDVVIAARDEERTIEPIVSSLTRAGHEVIVVDSGSTDGTARRARAAGARVIESDGPGKGRALRAGVQETRSEVVAFCDADLTCFDPSWVTALAAPLGDPGTQLVKPLYRRPLQLPGLGPVMGEGGRLTEILARPLLDALYPELAHLAQPLAGEYAARRSALFASSFPDGYGVEIALLLQVADRFGPTSVVEVDLHGERWHRNRPLRELSVTAREVLRTALTVLDDLGRIKLEELDRVSLQFPRPHSRG